MAKLTDEQYKEFTELLLEAGECAYACGDGVESVAFVLTLESKHRQYGRSVLVTNSQLNTLREIADRDR